ncbi:Fur family transcriptional regulator [Pantoea sp. 18069]|uniref:Fur family transcriptional regulator n=1 Tax=Pantoea sp. 18069 TaxID=2681415 RepID=UPI0027D241F4|nr:transcriptional repressor [Pantoea sp. 18069]
MNGDSILEGLRASHLRPTMARIATLQVLAGFGTRAASIEELHRALIGRGTKVSLGTVYRTMQELESRGLLLREWARHRKAMYRLKPAGYDSPALLRLVCRNSGRSVPLEAAKLHAQLLSAASAAGYDLTGQVLRVEVDSLKERSAHN